MKLFIIGQSRSGKTTLAKHIAHTCHLRHISASNWVKQVWHLSEQDFPSREAYIQAITDYSLEYLRKSPHACVDYIRQQLQQPLTSPQFCTIIDGIRNPYDFVNLFDQQRDRCLHLVYLSNPIATNNFEQGLTVIQAYLDWLLTNHLIQPHQATNLTFQTFDRADYNTALASFLQGIPEPVDKNSCVGCVSAA